MRPIRLLLAALGAGVLFAVATAGPAAAQDGELPGGGGPVPVLLPPEICALFISVFGEAPLLCAPLPKGDSAPPSPETTVTTMAASPVPSGPGARTDAAPPTAVSSTIEEAAPAPGPPTPIRAVQRVLTTIGQGFQLQVWIAVISLVLLTGYVGATSAPGRKTDDSSR